MFFLKQCFTVQVYKSSITLLRHIFRNLPGLRIATNHRNDKYYKYYYYFFHIKISQPALWKDYL